MPLELINPDELHTPLSYTPRPRASAEPQGFGAGAQRGLRAGGLC